MIVSSNQRTGCSWSPAPYCKETIISSCKSYCFFFSSRRRHTISVSAFLLNRSSDLLIRHHDYDQCFQSVQLLQWNSQVKFNVTVYRNLPTTRDSIMTS